MTTAAVPLLASLITNMIGSIYSKKQREAKECTGTFADVGILKTVFAFNF